DIDGKMPSYTRSNQQRIHGKPTSAGLGRLPNPAGGPWSEAVALEGLLENTRREGLALQEGANLSRHMEMCLAGGHGEIGFGSRIPFAAPVMHRGADAGTR